MLPNKLGFGCLLLNIGIHKHLWGRKKVFMKKLSNVGELGTP